MRVTTLRALAQAFTTTIRGLTPALEIYQDRRWRPVDDLELVPSGEVRNFYVDMPDTRPVVDGIYSPDGIEHEVTCLLYTSYGNLRREEQRGLAARDANQVWLALDVLRDSNPATTIAGLVSIEHTGWQVENDEQASYWGAHTFVVRYFANGL